MWHLTADRLSSLLIRPCIDKQLLPRHAYNTASTAATANSRAMFQFQNLNSFIVSCVLRNSSWTCWQKERKKEWRRGEKRNRKNCPRDTLNCDVHWFLYAAILEMEKQREKKDAFEIHLRTLPYFFIVPQFLFLSINFKYFWMLRNRFLIPSRFFPGDNVDCWMEIQQGKGPWASPVTGIVPLGTTLTMVVGIDDKQGKWRLPKRSNLDLRCTPYYNCGWHICHGSIIYDCSISIDSLRPVLLLRWKKGQD